MEEQVEYEEYPLPLAVVDLFVSSTSIVGNLLMIASVCFAKKQDVTLLMLATTSRSLATLCFCATNVAFVAYDVSLNQFTRTEIHTSFKLLGLIIFFMASNIFHLSLISLQRLFAIAYPFRYARATKKKQTLTLMVMWIMGFVAFSIFILVNKLNKDTKSEEMLLLLTALRVYSSDIPFLITVVATLSMFIVYSKYKREVSLGPVSRSRSTEERNHGRVVKMTSLIVIGYSIAMAPALVYDVYFMSSGCFPDGLLYSIIFIILKLSVVVDLVVYGKYDEHFKCFIKTCLRQVEIKSFLQKKKYPGKKVQVKTIEANNLH